MNSYRLTKETAELIGLHIGDGTIYKTTRSIVWELRGDLKEKEYYSNHITPLMEAIFKMTFDSKFRSGGKNGCWGIQTSNKMVSSFFLEKGFSVGRKSHTVFIPNYIFNSNRSIQRALVRGIFDTDGCLRFDKINKSKVSSYPKIEFGFASKALRDTLKELVELLGFRSYTWNIKEKEFKMCIAGKMQLKKWMAEISPKNPKHLYKYTIWKKTGCYKAEMAQPGTAQIIPKI